MGYRGIEGIFTGAPFSYVGDGFRVSNFFPNGNNFGNRLSPFILFDYGAPHYFPPTKELRGVGAHPHRGFETVTIAYEGRVEHHDSFGNHGIIGPGDVQWMTAGSGLLHKEYQEKQFAAAGGVMHMIQLWVNLPAQHKSHTPRYQELLKENMGYAELPQGGGRVRVISGSYQDVQGPAQTFTPVTLFDITFAKAGATAKFSLDDSHNSAIMVLGGEARINEQHHVRANQFVLLRNEQGSNHVEALTDDALVLILSGQPINEPVVQYGPFVMNTREEIVQAYNDFQTGKYGSLD